MTEPIILVDMPTDTVSSLLVEAVCYHGDADGPDADLNADLRASWYAACLSLAAAGTNQ
jgi:hypothetical protein